MYVIESINTKLKFIVGIFDNSEECYKQYFQLSSNNFKVKKLALNFPFYIIEIDNTFEYYQQEIKKIDEGTIYYIDTKFIPSVAGADEMGLLNHTHFESISN